jgi:hypothetical protein
MRGRLETARDGALHKIAPRDDLAAVRIEACLFARIGIGELPIGVGLLASVAERSLVHDQLAAFAVAARDRHAATIRVTGDGGLVGDFDLAIVAARLIATPEATSLAEALLTLALLPAALSLRLLSLLLASRSVASLTLP